MIRQSCPNCAAVHDVGVYVTGQKVLCRCGIRFEVRRTDVSQVGGRVPSAIAPAAGLSPVPTVGPPRSRVSPAEPAPSPLPPPVAEPPVNGAPPANAVVEGLGPEPEPVPEGDRTFISSSTRIHIPGYELIQVLGRGGMGEVWRAEQKSLGRTVAVKLLPPKLASDREFVTRFEKEATALASLSHPNIIQIIDRGVAAEHYYFVMEFVPGRSLREVMNGGAMSSVEALKIVAQICRAIEHAHDHHIIHRDLKPENILLDERGHVKVADFGLAGIRGGGGTDPRLQLTATSVAMGTVNYMAPEQRRDAKHVDGRADLYSLGVILYELLTGELPIGRFKLPSERIAGLDARIDHIVSRTLEPELEQRYQRASEVLGELEAVIGGSSAGPMSAEGAVARAGVNTARDRGQGAKSVIQHGWRGVRGALMVIGALSVLAYLAQRGLFGKVERDGKPAGLINGVLHAFDGHGHEGPGKFPPNTNGELFVGAGVQELGKGVQELSLRFEQGEEEINAHAGYWRLEDARLKATQAGSETDGQKLVPRAYVAHRYFSSDDFSAEVEIRMRDLEKDFPSEPDAQHFAELAFRIKDLQVSAFAIPGANMRLGWRYYTPDGIEQVGNSARDLENMVEDEMPVPADGRPFRVRLTLRRKKNAVEVEGFVNDQRFVRKQLIGLEGRVGKIALGCRNLQCEFQDLVVVGKTAQRPGRPEAE